MEPSRPMNRYGGLHAGPPPPAGRRAHTPFEEARVSAQTLVKGTRQVLIFAGLMAAVFVVGGRAAASSEVPEAPVGCGPAMTCSAQLKCLGRDELLSLFAGANGCFLPWGFGRGELLMRVDTKHAELKTRLANRAWKGKHFEEDGYFINQWVGFKALHSCAVQGPSWFDGRPCVILEYPAGTPLFANMHDELREVCPGLWLGLCFERGPCPKLRGIFVLQYEPEKPRHCRRH
jgi:hypothetical protein